MSKVLEDAKALVDDIYKSMTKVETCETLSEAVSEQEVVLVKPGGERYVRLDGVLTEEQLLDVKKYIQSTIDSNKAEAERFLRKVSGKAAILNQDFEEAVEDMVSSGAKDSQEPAEANQEAVEDEPEEAPEKSEIEEPEKKMTPELTLDAVRAVYTEGDMTIRQAADHFGVSQSKLYSFISEHGLRKPKKDNTPWRTGSHQ